MIKKYLLIFLVSMVPIVELRGAIPIAVGKGLPLLPSYIICILGNIIPVPFIFFFARRILEWGSDKKYIGKFFTWCLKKGEKGGKKLQKKAGNGLYIALLLFVGIPLPGTGAWTGTLAASILDMDFKTSIIAVMLGVILFSMEKYKVNAIKYDYYYILEKDGSKSRTHYGGQCEPMGKPSANHFSRFRTRRVAGCVHRVTLQDD